MESIGPSLSDAEMQVKFCGGQNAHSSRTYSPELRVTSHAFLSKQRNDVIPKTTALRNETTAMRILYFGNSSMKFFRNWKGSERGFLKVVYSGAKSLKFDPCRQNSIHFSERKHLLISLGRRKSFRAN